MKAQPARPRGADFARAEPMTWTASRGRDRTPRRYRGVALYLGASERYTRLSVADALALADQLVDAAEAAETEEGAR